MGFSDIILGLIVAIVAGVMLFVAIIFGTAFGALTGYLLSLTILGDWIISGFKMFGFNISGNLTVVGAMLGFLSGFFKTSVTK